MSMLQSVRDWIASGAERSLVQMDRALVERGRLRAFIQLAWPCVEKEGTYRGNWHIDAICEHLEAVSDGHIKRLAIAIPPRHMKSISTAVMWPAWDWIGHPERRFLFSSYAHNLSIRDGTRCRRVLSSPWFTARWGDRFKITSDQNTKVKFENNKTGYRMCTSVKGQLTGEGGDFVVCLPADAKILTEIGQRRIADVVHGEDRMVASYDQEAGEIVFRPIERKIVNPPRQMVEVQTSDGRVLRCTENHPVWVEGRGYVPAGDLDEGDEVLVWPDASTGSPFPTAKPTSASADTA